MIAALYLKHPGGDIMLNWVEFTEETACDVVFEGLGYAWNLKIFRVRTENNPVFRLEPDSVISAESVLNFHQNLRMNLY